MLSSSDRDLSSLLTPLSSNTAALSEVHVAVLKTVVIVGNVKRDFLLTRIQAIQHSSPRTEMPEPRVFTNLCSSWILSELYRWDTATSHGHWFYHVSNTKGRENVYSK